MIDDAGDVFYKTPMMNPKCLTILLSLSLTITAAFPLTSAQAQVGMDRSDVEFAYTDERPLVVVRFNQRNVYYERSLYGAVSKAVQVKPSVMFDVVAVSPIGRDRETQDRMKQLTARAGQKVMGSMREIGVPNSRMSYMETDDGAIEFPEVRIFAR